MSRSSLRAVRGKAAKALIGFLLLCSGLVLAPPLSAVVPLSTPVPVPNGRYGAVDAPTTTGTCISPDITTCYIPQQLVSFTVRNRKIVNPRVMIIVTCQYSDGTSSDVTFGPSSNVPSRSANIPRSGSGSITWVEEFDASLIRNATVTLGYTFYRNRNRTPLTSVEVRSTDPEATCYGTEPFRLGDVSEVPSSIFDPLPS